jgi:hypothetical protein
VRLRRVVSVIIYLFFRHRRANRPGDYLSGSWVFRRMNRCWKREWHDRGHPRAHDYVNTWQEEGFTVHQTHREAAEQHELAAHAHRTAAEHNEKGATEPAKWHAERALEFSDHAFRLAKEAHSKSGRMETVDVDTL